MAKWGEGDPRWIVEERADATNVNNWHWTEKNATQWSKDKIKSLLEGLDIANDEYCCAIKELTTLEGEASANNRKAKLIFFYEWVIKGEWQGNILGKDSTHKGKFEVTNLSEENDSDDLDVVITITDEKDDDAYKLKEFMRSKGAEVIRDMLGQYIADLKREYSRGMILPSKTSGKPEEKTPCTTDNVAKKQMNQPVMEDRGSSLGVRIPCKKLTDSQMFLCSPQDLYRALTDQPMVSGFTRGSAKVEAEKGGRFSLFDGAVSGEFTELVPDKRICMKWRNKSWPAEHYSEVKIELEESDGETRLTLTQSLVPDTDYEQTLQGWPRYYWDPIRQTFGFGAKLF